MQVHAEILNQDSDTISSLLTTKIKDLYLLKTGHEEAEHLEEEVVDEEIEDETHEEEVITVNKRDLVDTLSACRRAIQAAARVSPACRTMNINTQTGIPAQKGRAD